MTQSHIAPPIFGFPPGFFDQFRDVISQIPRSAVDGWAQFIKDNNATAESIGTAMQAIGDAARQVPGSIAEATGDVLIAAGRVLEYGPQALDNLNAQKIAEASISFGISAYLAVPVLELAMGLGVGLGSLVFGGIFGYSAPMRFSILAAAALQTVPMSASFLAFAASFYGISLLADKVAPIIVQSTIDTYRALSQLLKDPLVLDLDGDGVELISLANSNAHLDYGGDGFAERTGWVKGDDGILVFDRNGNGTVTPDAVWASEGSKRARPGCTVGNRRATNKPGCRVGNRRANAKMRGSATQDGFEVLETLDTNHDGKIVSFPAPLRHDAIDADFASPRVWQDANEDGVNNQGARRC